MTQSAHTTHHFAERILAWFYTHGRHNLPWQQHKKSEPNPYPVWISEVMLQQTQVSTVIPYFERFMQSFPTVQALANTDWETLAEHWAGLGYYARARNLHKGAKQLVQIIETTGDFPKTVAEWEQIAGVGKSTAGAIVAMGVRSTTEKGVICDGNVKRVLTRWAGIADDITKADTTKKLWHLADTLTPSQKSGDYAQAMMDMGATLCTKSKPKCDSCPIKQDCIAKSQNQQARYPVKSKKSPNPSKFSLALVLMDSQQQSLWLQRPDTGIWGGLYCLPLLFVKKQQQNKRLSDWQDGFDNEYTFAEQVIFDFLVQHRLLNTDSLFDHVDNNQNLEQKNHTIKHSLTHFHWFLTPIYIQLDDEQKQALEQLFINLKLSNHWQWLAQNDVKSLAIPTAMKKLIAKIC